MKYFYRIPLILLTLFGCNSKNKKTDSNYTIATSSESDERAKSVLPFEGQEDKSQLLKLNYNPANNQLKPDSTRYFANDKYDWILTIEPNSEDVFTRDSIDKYISNEWRKNVMYPTVYCLPENSSNWTYHFAGDNDDKYYKKIALAWKLYDPIEEPPLIYNEKSLLKIEELVKNRIVKINAEKISYNFTAKEAATASQRLSELVNKNNQWAYIVLKSDNEFEGEEIWDVMMSLGLKWGDMDLFHWNNTEFENGDDQVLSVWTSTAPGYFFPEDIADGKVQTSDLIFGFSIPRSLAPRDVFNVMCELTTYAQQRLGGQILNSEGNKLNKKDELKRIDSILSNLNKESINSGYGDALYLFQ